MIEDDDEVAVEEPMSATGALAPQLIADIIAHESYCPRDEGSRNVPFVTRRAPISLPLALGAQSRHHVFAMDPTTGSFASAEGNTVRVETSVLYSLPLANNGILPLHSSLPVHAGALRAESILFTTIPNYSQDCGIIAQDDPVHHLILFIGTSDGRLLVYRPHYGGGNAMTYALVAVASAAGAIREARGEENAEATNDKKPKNNKSRKGLHSLGANDFSIHPTHGDGEHVNLFLGKPLGYYAVTSIACSRSPFASHQSKQRLLGREVVLIHTGTACGELLVWEMECDSIRGPTQQRFGNNNGLADGYDSDEGHGGHRVPRRNTGPDSTRPIPPPCIKVLRSVSRVPISDMLPTIKPYPGAEHISQLVVPEPLGLCTGGDPYELPSSRILWLSVAAGGLCRLVFGACEMECSERRLWLESAEIWQYPERARGGPGQDMSLLDFRTGMPFAILHDTCFWPHISSMSVLIAMPSNLPSRLQSGKANDEIADGMSCSEVLFSNSAVRYAGHEGSACHGGEAEKDFRAKRTISVKFLEHKHHAAAGALNNTAIPSEDDNALSGTESEEDYNRMLAKAFGDVKEGSDEDDNESRFFSKIGNQNDSNAKTQKHRGRGPSSTSNHAPSSNQKSRSLKPNVVAKGPIAFPNISAEKVNRQPDIGAPIILSHPADTGLLSLPPFCFAPTCCQAVPTEESVLIGFVNGDVSMIRLSDVSMSQNLA